VAVGLFRIITAGGMYRCHCLMLKGRYGLVEFFTHLSTLENDDSTLPESH